jgi:mannose-6-phosphate isomerase-like protein (cupin superfamily)
MPPRPAALAGAVMLLTGAAGAQTPQPAPAAPRAPEYYSAATLAATADSLRAQHTVARVLGDRGTYQYVLVVRDTTPVPEQHAKWTDVMLVQAGTATVLLGGRYEGGHEDAPGETRGGRLVGASPRNVAPGDLLVIPAGVPHQVQVAPGTVVRYVTIKAPESR